MSDNLWGIDNYLRTPYSARLPIGHGQSHARLKTLFVVIFAYLQLRVITAVRIHVRTTATVSTDRMVTLVPAFLASMAETAKQVSSVWNCYSLIYVFCGG